MSHKQLRRLSNPQLAMLLVNEYLAHNDPRALSLLQSTWPDTDWPRFIARLRAREDHTLTLAE
jgi:hypothetical protein